jgi:osmotically-inducible protein OsmY
MKTDRELRADILAELERDPRVRSTETGVLVEHGAVTLTGVVEDFADKEGIAERVADIEREIASALHRHANIEASRVRVSVAGSKVTLDGTVDAVHERELIEDAVRHTRGVTDVIDNLAVGVVDRRSASAPDVG